jgi:hypothetical protein
MNAVAIAKYSSESLGSISIESLERVFPLDVRGVISRRFKVGNTAGEYTGCGSSPHHLANFFVRQPPFNLNICIRDHISTFAAGLRRDLLTLPGLAGG